MIPRFLTRMVSSMLAEQGRQVEIPRKVLIVEDDLTLEPFWDAVFYKIDPSIVVDWVVTAEAGEILISRSASAGSPYSIIISDLFLLGSKTGVDLWREYNESISNFILISVIEPQKILRMCGRMAEPPEVICKPLDARECVRVVRSALRKDMHRGLTTLRGVDAESSSV